MYSNKSPRGHSPHARGHSHRLMFPILIGVHIVYNNKTFEMIEQTHNKDKKTNTCLIKQKLQYKYFDLNSHLMPAVLLYFTHCLFSTGRKWVKQV